MALLLKTIEKCENAQKLIDSGLNTGKALKQMSLGSATFYEWKKANGLLMSQRDPKPKKPIPFVQTIAVQPEQPESNEKIVCLIGSAKEIIEAVKQLRG